MHFKNLVPKLHLGMYLYSKLRFERIIRTIDYKKKFNTNPVRGEILITNYLPKIKAPCLQQAGIGAT